MKSVRGESAGTTLVPIDRIERRILQVRGRRVILDADLADLYGVSTKRLNEQVKRNADRFPSDFMFRVNREEAGLLKSQNATSKEGRGGRRSRPFVFTEHGAIMAANVLNSPRAVRASVLVVRAFVRLRGTWAAHEELARKLAELQDRVGGHDTAIQDIVRALRDLMEAPPDAPRERIGFRTAPRE